MLLHSASRQSWVLYTQKINRLLAIHFFICGTEGDGEMFTSFTSRNVLIGASKTSLKAIIATHHMQVGCKWEHCTHGKQMLVC